MKLTLNKLHAYWTLMRPYQWQKNVLLFGGLVFSMSLDSLSIIINSLSGFFLFCLISSSIYILNDIFDIEEDRLHPVKKNRPLASGRVSVSNAVILLVILLIIALTGSILLSYKFAGIIVLYFLLNLAYSLGLKKVVILDVMIVAIGFLLRAMAGCVAIHVNISAWLFICTLLLALLLSFGKRRGEISLLKETANKHRHSLEDYSLPFLDTMMTICGTATVLSYSLYTMAPETIERFHTHKLLYTTPFVLFGVFRYFYLIFQKNEGGDPSKLLITDLQTVINGTLWIVVVSIFIYVPMFRLFD